MATAIVRNPLATKAHSQHASAPGMAWHTTRKHNPTKRAHSPEPHADAHGSSSKRVKAAPEVAAASAQERKARRVEREQEFRDKYTKAFPNWVFYFDMESVGSGVKDVLGKRVAQMGAVCISLPGPRPPLVAEHRMNSAPMISSPVTSHILLHKRAWKNLRKRRTSSSRAGPTMVAVS